MRPRFIVLIIACLAIAVFVAVAYQLRHDYSRAPLRIDKPRAIPPIATLQAPARMNVVVTPADGDPGDSVREILARDFDLSDWLRVVPADSSARAVVVQPTFTTRGVRIALVDGATGVTVRSAEFPLPSLATPDSMAVSDSLARDLAAKDAVTRTLLDHNARLADSLHRVQRRWYIPLWWMEPEQPDTPQMVARDSLLSVLRHADADIRARAQRDTLLNLALRRVLWRRSRAQRDSVVYAWRWAVHGVADQLTEWIAGHRGIAQSRVAYISRGQVRVIDADGGGDHAVTPPGMVMSPAWRHDGHALVYSHFNNDGTQIAELNLSTRVVSFLSTVPRGLNITPVYSPDDQWVVLGHGGGWGGTDLIAVSRVTGVLKRIVGGGYDNTGPVFGERGSRIAFSSARSHTPQIYSVKPDGSDERLETPVAPKGRSYRTSPDWSPDGRAIAFQQQNGNFQLWMVTVADHVLHRLTKIGENEDPSWAPDSRHLVLSSTRQGVKNLWVLDVPSGRMRQLTKAGEGRLAAWSPVTP